MNHIFRVIWNRRLRLWQCVSEKTSPNGKSSTRTVSTVTHPPHPLVTSAFAPLFTPPSLQTVLRPLAVLGLSGLLSTTLSMPSLASTVEMTNGGYTLNINIDEGDSVTMSETGHDTLTSYENAAPDFDEKGTVVKRGKGTFYLDREQPNFKGTESGALVVEEGTIVLGDDSREFPTPVYWLGTGKMTIKKDATLVMARGFITVDALDNGERVEHGNPIDNYGKLITRNPRHKPTENEQSLVLTAPSKDYTMHAGSEWWIEDTVVRIDPTGYGVRHGSVLSGETALHFGLSPSTAQKLSTNPNFAYGVINRGEWADDGLPKEAGLVLVNQAPGMTFSSITFGHGLENHQPRNPTVMWPWIRNTMSLRNSTVAVGDVTTLVTGAAKFVTDGTSTLQVVGGTRAAPTHLFDNFVSEQTKALKALTLMNGAQLTLEVQGVAERQAGQLFQKDGYSGAGSLVKTGAGRLIVHDLETTTNATWTLKEGTLEFNNRDAQGRSTMATTDITRVKGDGTVVDATTDLYSATMAFSGEHEVTTALFAGNGRDRVNVEVASGKYTVSKAQSYRGQTRIRGGELVLSNANDSAAGPDTMVAYLGSSATAVDTGEGEEKGRLTFAVKSSDTQNFTRTITGTGEVMVANSRAPWTARYGKVVFSAPSGEYDYSGVTHVLSGFLEIAEDQHVSQTAEVFIGGGSEAADEHHWRVAELVVKGELTTPGKIKIGEGARGTSHNTLVLDGSTLTAKTIVRGRSVGTSGLNQNTLELSHQAKLVITDDTEDLFADFNGHDQDYVELGTGGGILHVDAGLTVRQFFNSVISTFLPGDETSLTKTGQGTLVIQGLNTYEGQLRVEEGTLQVGGGTMRTSAASMGGSGDIIFGENTRYVLNMDAWWWDRYQDISYVRNYRLGEGRRVTGGATVIQEGQRTVVVDQPHTYTGNTVIHSGIVSLVDGGRLGIDTNKVITGEDATKKGTLEVNNAREMTLPQLIEGTGDVVKRGTGKLTLSSAVESKDYSYSGKTRVAGG